VKESDKLDKPSSPPSDEVGKPGKLGAAVPAKSPSASQMRPGR
jgi:hypothetical protein